MKHEKTFEAINKLKEVEIELHRLKNALEMANRALDAKYEWVGLTEEEIDQGLLRSPYVLQSAGAWRDGVRWAEEILNRRNT
jgi:hypothetical protein